MTNPIPEDDDEPLDPKVEAVQRRIQRMLLVSRGIMVVGLIAVVVAIFYRLGGDDDSAPTTAAATGSTVRHVAIEGDRIVLVIRGTDGRETVRVQTMDGALVSETVLP